MTEREVSSERVSEERLREIIADFSGAGKTTGAYLSQATELVSLASELLSLRSSVKTEDADEDVFAALAEEELLSAIEAPAAASEVTDAAQFLIDRLDDFERGSLCDTIEDACRDFDGHVSPAIERLRALTSSLKGDRS